MNTSTMICIVLLVVCIIILHFHIISLQKRLANLGQCHNDACSVIDRRAETLDRIEEYLATVDNSLDITRILVNTLQDIDRKT